MWWDILKMAKPIMPGSDFKSSEEYNRGTREQKMAYHKRMRGAYDINLKILQGQASGSLSDADPVVDEHPVNQEIDRLQEMVRFHGRQHQRLRKNSIKQDFFTLEEESNRRQTIPKTTRTGSRIVHKEISQEEYDELNDKQKFHYHQRLARQYKKEGNDKLSIFHNAMASRKYQSPNLSTFSKYKEGYNRVEERNIYTKEEYLQMANNDKKNYHYRMASRAQRKGNKDLASWHRKMAERIRKNINLPTYFSPEHEQEETQ